MRISSVPDDDEFDVGFTTPVNLLDLSDFGERITHLLTSIDGGTSLVIDGKWGTGKTYFAKMLVGHLKSEGVPTVYFNAFQHDHSSEPFEAVSAAVTKLADSLTGDLSKTRDKFLDSAAKVGKGLARGAGRIGVRVATAGLVDLTDIELIQSTVDNIGDINEEILEQAIRSSIVSNAASELAVQSFKDTLQELQQKISTNGELPLVIVIDELDRCRPDFSIGILEAIKHYFGIEKVHYVLVTNLQQMENYVDHTYGTANHSKDYLEKFYDLHVVFPPVGLEHKYERDRDKIIDKYVAELLPDQYSEPKFRNAASELKNIPEYLGLNYRDTQKLTSYALIALLGLPENQFGPTYLIVQLSAMKVVTYDLFLKACNGTLSSNDVANFMSKMKGKGDDELYRNFDALKWATFSDDEASNQEYKRYDQWRFRYNIERTAIVPYITSLIESFSLVKDLASQN